MTTIQDQNTFESRMRKAIAALTRVQVELMDAQALSIISSGDLGRAWDLLWKSVHSCASLATVIRTAEAERSLLERGMQESLSAALPAPLVPPESAEYAALVEQLEESLRSADKMCTCAGEFYETLIQAGQGDSDAALAVSICRLYAHASSCLLETVRVQLPAPAVLANGAAAGNFRASGA